jgi:peptidoglycan/LPS O-acetylase OafA/YrhL
MQTPAKTPTQLVANRSDKIRAPADAYRSQTGASDIPELTTLRIFAALCVVVSHLHGLGAVSAERIHAILDGGRPAVSFFFVLSGFIMNHKYPRLSWRDMAATKQYAKSRFSRLYPTIVLALLIALPAGIFLAITNDNGQLLKLYALKDRYSLWLVLSALAQLTGLTGWIPAAAINQPWNGPAWSLSCEFFFYALFPCIRPALDRRPSHILLLVIVLGWILQGIWIGTIEALIPSNRSGFLVSQFPITHCFEFVLGICSGMFFNRMTRRQLTILVSLLSGATMLMYGALHFSDSFMPVYYGMSPLFAAAIVATAMASGSVWLSPLRNTVLLSLGHASYALYMIHVPILIMASILGIAAVFGWWWLPILMLASCLVHYRYAEPVRRHLLYRRADARRVV